MCNVGAGDTTLSLSSYTGVDMSATSLQLAAQQPLPLPLPADNGATSRRLVEQDMLGFLRAWQGGQHAQQKEAQQRRPKGEEKPTTSSEHEQEGRCQIQQTQQQQQEQQQQQAPAAEVAVATPPGEAYDVVLCALSVHHLQQHAKLELLRCARWALGPGGCLLLMDVFRKEGESREAYMERAHGYFFGEEARSVLSPEESDEVGLTYMIA